MADALDKRAIIKAALARHSTYKRYVDALALSACAVAMVASALGGSRAITIAWFSGAVFLIVSTGGHILIKTWTSWEDREYLQQAAGRTASRAKSKKK